MNSAQIALLKKRLKLAALERRIFKIRHDYPLLMLLILGSRKSPIRRQALIRKMGCSDVSFRKYFGELADLNLVENVSVERDRRIKLVALSSDGADAMRVYVNLILELV
jgi:hypothetical protein